MSAPALARPTTFFAFVAAAALGLTGCGGASSSSATSTSEGSGPAAASSASSPAAAPGVDAAAAAAVPAEIKADGILMAGMELGYPPFEYKDADNVTPIGFDVDMGNAIAAKLGLKLQIVDAKFDTIIPSLASKRYEIGISAFSVTAAREKQVDFVTYFQSGDAGLVLAGNPKRLGLDDRICGAKVAVLKGSTQESVTVPQLGKVCSTAGKPGPVVSTMDASNQMPLALQSGRVDLVLVDSGNGGYIAKVSNGKFEVADGPLLNAGPGGMAMGKGNGLAAAVAAAVQGLIDDGSYGQIAVKWNLKSGVVTKAVVNDPSVQ